MVLFSVRMADNKVIIPPPPPRLPPSLFLRVQRRATRVPEFRIAPPRSPTPLARVRSVTVNDPPAGTRNGRRVLPPLMVTPMSPVRPFRVISVLIGRAVFPTVVSWIWESVRKIFSPSRGAGRPLPYQRCQSGCRRRTSCQRPSRSTASTIPSPPLPEHQTPPFSPLNSLQVRLTSPQ